MGKVVDYNCVTLHNSAIQISGGFSKIRYCIYLVCTYIWNGCFNELRVASGLTPKKDRSEVIFSERGESQLQTHSVTRDCQVIITS